MESSGIISRSQRANTECTISASRCREWFLRFKFDGSRLEDKQGRGQPWDFEDEAFLISAEEIDESLLSESLDNFVPASTASTQCNKRFATPEIVNQGPPPKRRRQANVVEDIKNGIRRAEKKKRSFGICSPCCGTTCCHHFKKIVNTV
ncbi:hypothetical protein HNY73_007300 [Argiope bruennichi]|uniref:Uncharacterized protein n=1 Tax=Argiope bruennichi TaxID=94029 RepID=A0A8T0FIK5_ARGBR|nr:hypothetical protein HNY73_007300 [Argiope bruennichi]